MNRQPYGTPPKWWEPKLSPKWVKLTRRYRWRKLRRGQRLMSVDASGLEHVRGAVDAGQGVLIAPNHSAHYDSEALYVAMDRLSLPVYFMTAWQVFGMSNRLERFLMQRMGCFSIDRESTDRQAFKQAIQVLQNDRHPLVIFPEGDIYHVTDEVTPFREGAAAIALSAAKRSDRPIVIIPCGIKFWYVEDPTDQLLRLVERLEERVLLRPQSGLALTDRVYRLAEGVLALKELDFLGHTRTGSLPKRIEHLSETVLSRLEEQHDVKSTDGTIPERVKGLRQSIIRKVNGDEKSSDLQESDYQRLEREMDDLFFVMQLYSYPGDYLRQQPSVERLAETLDKFEEDILQVDLPSVRGRRRVTIRFGEPISVSNNGERRRSAAELTHTMQIAVQSILDDMNSESRDGQNTREEPVSA